MLQDKMAPDPLCGRARLEGNFDETVCTKTLYNYIDQGLLRVKNIDLPLRVRRKRKAARLRKHCRCYGESIEERPVEVESRDTFGHWEIDTVTGSADSSEVLLTLDERMTRKRHIVKLPAKTAKAVEKGLKQRLSTFFWFFSIFFRCFLRFHQLPWESSTFSWCCIKAPSSSGVHQFFLKFFSFFRCCKRNTGFFFRFTRLSGSSPRFPGAAKKLLFFPVFLLDLIRFSSGLPWTDCKVK